jgi:hypothetical protein
MNHITRHYDYNLGFKPLQFGLQGGLGAKYTFLPQLTFSVECVFERGGRFFGTYAKDLSRTNSLIVQTSLLYNLDAK